MRALFVEDSEDDVQLLLRELRRGSFDVTFERVDTAEAMNAALEKQTWDIVLSDYSMPRFDAPSALSSMREKGLDTPSSSSRGQSGRRRLPQAMGTGVNDYIPNGRLARVRPGRSSENWELRCGSNAGRCKSS